MNPAAAIAPAITPVGLAAPACGTDDISEAEPPPCDPAPLDDPVVVAVTPVAVALIIGMRDVSPAASVGAVPVQSPAV